MKSTSIGRALRVVRMIAQLRARRETMLAYLRLRLELNDMHGVMDAAADIREIDAEIRALENTCQ